MEETSGNRHRHTPSATLLLLGLLWPLSARAYRPFNSTDAAVAAKGEVEIEFGPLGFVKEGPDRSLVAPSVILNWGFAERYELVLEGRQFVQLGNEISQPRFRVEDTALSLKAVLLEGGLQEKTGLSVATELVRSCRPSMETRAWVARVRSSSRSDGPT